MKRVLVISYYWPPSGGAGVQRWLKFVKYLRNFGWEPVVYCPEGAEYPETDHSLAADIPAGLEILRQPIWEPYDFYKKLLGQKKETRISAGFLSETRKNPVLENLSVWIRGNLFIPDARKFWIRPSVKFLSKYLNRHPVDAIVSTGPPHSMHIIAMQISEHLNIPWLADFRDPWTNIDFYKDLKLTRVADGIHRRMEKKVLRKAHAVTVISRSMATDFGNICPRSYDVITNGFDDSDMPAPSPSERDRKFSLAHIGSLVSTRNPEVLWKALKDLVDSDPGFAGNLEIKLVGRVDIMVMKSLESQGLSQFVNKIPYMPHNEVVRCQQQSQVLLLLINNTPNSQMILTGKFFEYMAARRPVLCIGPEDGDAARILEETGCGVISGFTDTEKLTRNIRTLYDRYLSGNLENGLSEIGRYSRRELTRNLSDVLNRISG